MRIVYKVNSHCYVDILLFWLCVLYLISHFCKIVEDLRIAIVVIVNVSTRYFVA